jgi:hypothetical protein
MKFIEVVEELLRLMKVASHELTHYSSAVMVGRELKLLLSMSTLPVVLYSFGTGLGLFAAITTTIASLHLGITWIRRHRANVFISFHHDREMAANALAAHLARLGTRPTKLPFLESPEHDALLTQVQGSIQRCDVFVCIPGDRPSFVENEVAMAFGLEKPLLFILSEADHSRLPNTAMKGYPIFSLEKIEDGRYGSLARLCSYLAADLRSTRNLYLEIFEHLFVSLATCFLVYVLSAAIAMRIVPGLTNPAVVFTDASLFGEASAFPWESTSTTLVVVNVLLLLVPTLAFFAVRQ